MNIKRIFAALMCIVMTLSCCSLAFAGSPIVKVNINIGQGETKDLTTYMKSDAGDITWTGGNKSIAVVSGKSVRGVKVGTTIYTGTTASAKYIFTVKVLANFSTPATVINTAAVKNNEIKNSNGDKINYKDFYISMGPNDKLDISSYLRKGAKYYDYSWGVSNEKYLDFKQGKLLAKAEGLVRVNATSRTNNEKNTIYRFFVTIDSNYLAKNITVGRTTLTPLTNYLGEAPENYILTAKGITGTAVSISGNYIAAGSVNAKGSDPNVSVVTAESTTGGINYCFIVKIR